MDTKVFSRRLIVSAVFVLLFFLSGLSFAHAEVGNGKKIDDSVMTKIEAFLKQKGYGNINQIEGEEYPIENGYFFKIDGLDKNTNKSYAIEMVVTPDFSTWILLAVKEKTAAKSLPKKE